MMTLYWSRIDAVLWNKEQSNFNIIYIIIPQIVSCAYYYYWQKTRSITRKISEQEYQLLNLEKLKSKAQLDALEAKINPHFLYNSLNSIAGLIHEKPDKAEEMTIQLSKLFRYTTGRNEENFHTIEDELEIIKAYLAIEQVRFGKRLSYSIDCEEGVLLHKIPRFLLQPLVENAIKHGISKIAHAGEIKVEIKQMNGNITIKIHDNGPDFGEAVGGGFGLRSIKEKLKIVYGEKAIFEVKNEPEKAVIITLPDMERR
jgi:two-component system, LytTR family, sensor kinase